MRQLINSTQISNWFTSVSRDAQELLPHLIRKLIAAAVPPQSLKTFVLPVGDDIRRRGFDGFVESVANHPFVPTGRSVWEFGVGEPAEKFESDYAKRSVLPDTHFVFVTPHAWAGKAKVAAEKNGEGRWGSVTILDNTDLEVWIDLTPAVGRWLAQQMGVPIDGLDTLETFSRTIESRYRAKLSTSLVIGGRQTEVGRLRTWLTSGEPLITLKAETMQEGALFLGAVVDSIEDGQLRDRLRSTVVIVESVSAVEYLAAGSSPLIIVPTSLEASRRARAVASNCFRLVDIVRQRSAERETSNEIVKLGPVRRQAVHQALTALGMSEVRSSRIATECKGSFTATLMMLGSSDDLLPWARGEVAYHIAPLALIGQWDSTNERDWAIVERLCDRPRDKIEPFIAEWSGPSGPLTRRGTVIDWIAWDFSWRELVPQSTDQLLARFVEVATETLSAPDPTLELEPDKRFMAQIYGKVHPYSVQLRRGLIDNLILLGMYGDELPRSNGQSIADRVVRALLNCPEEELSTRWLSLAWTLDDLVEASPREFLSATDRLLNSVAAFEAMFHEQEGFGFPSSHHTHLLWALERLAWCQKYLTRVIVCLGSLAARDPGGRLGNRPGRSLREILLPWKPGTNASVEERLKSLNALHIVEPEQAWKLAKSLLPTDHDVAMPTNRPRWRNWADQQQGNVSYVDYFASIENITRRLIEWATNQASKWTELINEIPPLWHAHRDLASELLQKLSALSIESWSTIERGRFTDVLRPLIGRHRRFAEATWALPRDALDELSKLLERAKPDDLVLIHAFLFSHGVELEELAHDDWRKREEQLSKLRMDAIKAIYEAGNISEVERLGEAVEQPHLIGFELAKAFGSNLLDIWAVGIFLQGTKGCQAPTKREELAKSYLINRYWLNGKHGWLSLLKKQHVEWREEFTARLCSLFSPDDNLWNLIDAWSDGVSSWYWRIVPLGFVQNINGQLSRAVSKLLEVRRPLQAIHLLGMHAHGSQAGEDNLSPDRIEASLKMALEMSPEEEQPKLKIAGHDVAALMDCLEKSGSQFRVMVQLEWGWLPALKYTSRGIRALQTAVCTDPQFFVDLLKHAFRGDAEPPRDLTDQERIIPRRAFELLADVHNCPGLTRATSVADEDGNVSFVGGDLNEKALFDWVITARDLATGANRRSVCDTYIGHFLAFSPANNDGLWPCEGVCKLLQSLASDSVENGLQIAVHNKRGYHLVQPEGKQEKQIEKKFREYADAWRDSYPRVASVLDAIAADYELEAKSAVDREGFEEFDR